MKRIDGYPRKDYKKKVEELGLVWANSNEYWHETSYYTFGRSEIDVLERATEEVHQLCIEAAQYAIDNNMLESHFDIPERFVPHVISSWNAEPHCLNFGRFDFGYDGINPPKLFEYNCDTPTSMLEMGVIQWQWKEDIFPFHDQFNSLHEKMVEAYRKMPYNDITFTNVFDDIGEDAITIAYHMDLATEAGKNVYRIHMDDIGYNSLTKTFVDLDDNDIDVIFKLYPWEWLVHDEFGQHIPQSPTQWIEPMWKMLWSNKAILPILWKLYPNHPNLLEASFEPINGNYVKKPTLAREGANVTINLNGQTLSTDGDYGDGRYVYQRLYNLPKFDEHYPIIGSWCVDGYAAGIGIREGGLITNNTSRFTPHIISGF